MRGEVISGAGVDGGGGEEAGRGWSAGAIQQELVAWITARRTGDSVGAFPT